MAVRSIEPYSYRGDPRVPSFADDRPLIVFDGYCALCSATARFVMRHDPAKKFRLLPAQSPIGQALYMHYGLSPETLETIILIANGVAWFKSEAAIRLGQGLGAPWSAAAALRLLPLAARDAAYECVARNRFRLFGRRDTCFLPRDDDADRFLM